MIPKVITNGRTLQIPRTKKKAATKAPLQIVMIPVFIYTLQSLKLFFIEKSFLNPAVL